MRSAIRILGITIFLIVSGLALEAVAYGYEHKLQFSPYIPYNPVFGQVTVIGEQFTFDANNQVNGVTGLIHFQTVPSGCRYYCPRTNHDWTGTWDLDGNLLNVIETAWTPQQPIGSTIATTPNSGLAETIYAETTLPNGNLITTGKDVQNHGYVDTLRSHYDWQYTIPGEYTYGHFVIQNTPPFVFEVTLASDGDLPLDITSTVIQVTASGFYTNGTGTATYNPQPGDCLSAPIASGATCQIQITFDPSTIISTGSPYGYAYNNLTLALASDAGNLPDFAVAFTITGFSTND